MCDTCDMWTSKSSNSGNCGNEVFCLKGTSEKAFLQPNYKNQKLQRHAFWWSLVHQENCVALRVTAMWCNVTCKPREVQLDVQPMAIWIHLALYDAAEFWVRVLNPIVQTCQTSVFHKTRGTKRNKDIQNSRTCSTRSPATGDDTLHLCFFHRTSELSQLHHLDAPCPPCSACPGPNNGPWKRHRTMDEPYGTIRWESSWATRIRRIRQNSWKVFHLTENHSNRKW